MTMGSHNAVVFLARGGDGVMDFTRLLRPKKVCLFKMKL